MPNKIHDLIDIALPRASHRGLTVPSPSIGHSKDRLAGDLRARARSTDRQFLPSVLLLRPGMSRAVVSSVGFGR